MAPVVVVHDDVELSESQVEESSAPRRAVLIVNTKSRRGKEWFERAQELLTAQGVELEAARAFKTIQELIAEAKAAVAREVPLIIAGGGDGTFSAIARYFVGSQSVLGVLPLGTGNAFARDLGIPGDLEEACRVLAEGKVARVDLGIGHDDYFLNVATIGLTTKIAQELTVPMKRKFGRFVYAIAMFNALRQVKPFTVCIETENGRVEFETLQLVIGNGRYHAGPFPLSPDASITEGQLSLYALTSASKWAFFKLAVMLPSGHHVDLPEVHYEQTTGGLITTFPPLPVTIDGEVCKATPMRFGVASDGLRVMAPQSFEG